MEDRPDIRSTVDRLERKLHALERADGSHALSRREPAVFGADRHRYSRHRVDDAEASAIGARLDITIPDELGALWTSIGFGVGPYYGLFGPDAVASEVGQWSDLAEEVGASFDLAGDFPLNWPTESPDSIQTLVGPTSGCLPISHQGDTFWSTLIMSGPQAGRVWDFAEFVTSEWQWIPGQRPPGNLRKPGPLPAFDGPPTLFEWYEGWLDQALATVAD